jgi:hypothetical protein
VVPAGSQRLFEIGANQSSWDEKTLFICPTSQKGAPNLKFSFLAIISALLKRKL